LHSQSSPIYVMKISLFSYDRNQEFCKGGGAKYTNTILLVTCDCSQFYFYNTKT